jgi:hypothetical protein
VLVLQQDWPGQHRRSGSSDCRRRGRLIRW